MHHINQYVIGTLLVITCGCDKPDKDVIAEYEDTKITFTEVQQLSELIQAHHTNADPNAMQVPNLESMLRGIILEKAYEHYDIKASREEIQEEINENQEKYTYFTDQTESSVENANRLRNRVVEIAELWRNDNESGYAALEELCKENPEIKESIQGLVKHTWPDDKIYEHWRRSAKESNISLEGIRRGAEMSASETIKQKKLVNTLNKTGILQSGQGLQDYFNIELNKVRFADGWSRGYTPENIKGLQIKPDKEPKPTTNIPYVTNIGKSDLNTREPEKNTKGSAIEIQIPTPMRGN